MTMTLPSGQCLYTSTALEMSKDLIDRVPILLYRPLTGKTVLASSSIDYLQSTFQQDSVAVLHLYCDFRTPRGCDTLFHVASLLQQVMLSHPSVVDVLNGWCESHREVRTYSGAEELFDFLQVSVSVFSKAFIVLDALDEILREARSGVLETLRRLQQISTVNLLIFSRTFPDLAHEMRHSTPLRLEDNGDKLKNDLKVYIENLIAILDS